MKRDITTSEQGHVIIEATIIFPILIIIVIALFYVGLFLCQRANLQANLQNALIYYKNIQSDTFVGLPDKEMTYVASANTSINGTQFKNDGYKFPYRNFFLKGDLKDSDSFKSFFREMTGTMFFDTGDNIEVTVKASNKILYKEIIATAKQEVASPVSFLLVGWDGKMTITSTASMTISDGDGFVQNVDFVADLIMKSKIGEKLKEFAEKTGELYGKVKGVFHIN